MELTRREFLKESLATLWFLALPGGLFAAPFLDEHSGELWMAPGAKPFFVVRHVAPQRVLCAALVKHPNAITLYGHAHGSAARWNMVRLHGGNAVIEMSACDARGDNLGLAGTLPIAKAKPEGETAAGYPRSAYLLRVYDDMLVVERREGESDALESVVRGDERSERFGVEVLGGLDLYWDDFRSTLHKEVDFNRRMASCYLRESQSFMRNAQKCGTV